MNPRAVIALRLASVALALASSITAHPAVAQPTAADFVKSNGNAQPLESAMAGVGVSQPDLFNGEYQYDVPIALPQLRGVEPKLGLSYHSGGKNGPLGPGWSIRGFSTIQRVGVNHKTPDLLGSGSTDIYLLDGAELLPCSAANGTSTSTGVIAAPALSPSCNNGGTHATKIENYKRIRFDGTNWTVTERDGSVATYEPLNQFPTLWGRTGVVTSRGTVSYAFGHCEADRSVGTCYPSSLSYGSTSVTLHATARTDHGTSFANGTASLGVGTILYRSVEILVDGLRSAAYDLRYESTDPTTGTSLLSSVQRFGRDYEIAPSGQVGAGSKLPRTSFQYSRLPASPLVPRPVGGPWPYLSNDTIVMGDFNGDARQDFLIQNDTQLALFTATGDATTPFAKRLLFVTGDPTSGAWTNGAYGRDTLVVGDFNGDDKSDLLIVDRSARKAMVFFGDPTAPFASSAPERTAVTLWTAGQPLNGWTPYAGDTYVAADVDGDGATDVLFTRSSSQNPDSWLFWGGATPFSSTPTRLWGASGPAAATGGDYLGWTLRDVWSNSALGCTLQSESRTTQIQLGDFNGDGRMDLVLTGDRSTCTGGYISGSSCTSCSTQAPKREFAIFTATGSRSAPFTNVKLAWTTDGVTPYRPYVTVGDFNADGKTDLLTMDTGTPGRGIVPRMSSGSVVDVTGAGFVAALDLSTKCGTTSGAWCFTTGGTSPTPYNDSISLGDFDGDGSTDLLIYNKAPAYAGRRAVIMGGGNPAAEMFSGATPSAAFPLPFFTASHGVLVGDFNGDGRSDLFDRAAWTVLLSQGPQPMLLSHVDNGSAGTIDVAYTPSSSWTNHNLGFVVQTVSSISASDGHTAFMPAGASGPTVATTQYSYIGGRWDVIDRRFLGFNEIYELQPCVGTVCPYRDTWYYQYYGSYSKPQQIEVGAVAANGARLPYSRHWYDYTTGATDANGQVVIAPPYMSQPYAEGIETYDGSGRDCADWHRGDAVAAPCPYGHRTSRVFQYDNVAEGRVYRAGFGNTTSIFDYGDRDVEGDETTTSVEFYPNAAAYMVTYSARTLTYGPDGTVLADAQTLYDDAQDYRTPPVTGKGFTTAVRRLRDLPTPKLVERRSRYDADGNLEDAWDENGNQTHYVYDPRYRLYVASVINAAGHETKYTWDWPCDEIATVTDPNGQAVTARYDAVCRISTLSLPAVGGQMGTRTFRYCDDPLMPSSVCGVADGASAQHVRIETPSADGRGVQWVEEYYDGAGRKYRTRTKGPDSAHSCSSVDSVYDALGKPAWTSSAYFAGDAVQWTSATFDVLGRSTAVTFPDRAGTTMTYGVVACADPAQGATCSRVDASDPLGHGTSTVVNARGQTVSVTNNRGTTTYRSDVLGRLRSIADAAGNTWDYTPDSLGRNVRVADADLGTWSYVYDDAGNLVQSTDAKGQTTHWAFDALNRRYHRWSDSSSSDYAWWYYDQVDATGTYFNKGHLTSIGDAGATGWSGLQTFSYDARGRLARWQRNVTGATVADFAVTSTYDDGDRPLTATYSAAVGGSELATFSVGPVTYDGSAQALSLPGLVTSATYDAVGRLLTRTNANGTTLTNTYSAERGWLTTRIVTGPGAALLQAGDYGSRDAEGKLTRFTNGRTSASWLYAYDTADRMYFAQTSCSADPRSAFYVYDSVDNITDRYLLTAGQYRTDHYAYEDPQHPHAVTQVGGAAYVYDANGSMTAGPVYGPDATGAISPAGTQTITYDVFNRMVTMGVNAYAYDADGARVVENRRVFATDDFFVDGTSVTAYVSFRGERIAKFSATSDGSTTIAWLHADRLGSVVNESDRWGGTGPYGPEQDYFPFGTPAIARKPEAFGFTGQMQDATSGIVYLHARYYDPYVGRFMSADSASPTEPGVGVNRYAYMMNDPIGGTDPSGHAVGPAEVYGFDLRRDAALAWGEVLKWWNGGQTAYAGKDPDLIHEPAKGGVGGFQGGIIRTLTFRLVPIEQNQSPASALGMDTGAGLVPFLDAGERLATARTCAQLQTSRLAAGIDLALQVLPWAWEATAARMGGGVLLREAIVANDILAAPRVGSALKVDVAKVEILGFQNYGRQAVAEFGARPLAHGFPNVIDNYAGQAHMFDLGRGANLYQLEGSLNGVAGRFEWVVDQGAVTHRMFVGGGRINGTPIIP